MCPTQHYTNQISTQTMQGILACNIIFEDPSWGTRVFACKSPKMTVSRTAAIIVNGNCPLKASDVQLTHECIPPLF